MKAIEIGQQILFSNPLHKNVSASPEFSERGGMLLASGEYEKQLKQVANKDTFNAFKDFGIGIGLILTPVLPAQLMGVGFSARAMGHFLRMTSEIGPLLMDNMPIKFGGRGNKETRR